MSVRLTRSNFNGPTLHSKLLKKDAQHAGVQKQTASVMKNAPDEYDILAFPESSSSEDEAQPQKHESVESSAKRKREDDDSPRTKRMKSSKQPIRKSRREQTDQEDQPVQQSQLPATGFTDIFATFDDPASSQSSQRRKKKSTYGKASQSSVTRSSPSTKPQISIPEDPSFNSPESKRKGFMNVTSSPSKSFTFSPRKNLKQPPAELPGSSQLSTVQFTLPEDPSLDDSGDSSLSKHENGKPFNIDDSPETTHHSRRGSTSSLSSVDSIASAYLSQTQKDDIRNGVESSQDLPPGYVQCPMCKGRVVRSIIPNSTKSRFNTDIPISPSKLSLRAQQAFCHNHQLATAKAQWIERKYPTIDWEDVEHRRIPAHLDHIRKVLFRKTQSHYLDQLDAAVKDAKGNARKLNTYLIHQHNGHLATTPTSSTSNKKPLTKSTTSKNGITKSLASESPSPSNPHSSTQAYYGPHGHKLMCTTLANTLSKPIRHALNSDATVRLAGVASFISAVLAPELCLRLVMEDLKSNKKKNDSDRESRRGAGKKESEAGVDDEVDEARRVMSESAEVGALVWPDEEIISDDERDDEDENEDGSS